MKTATAIIRYAVMRNDRMDSYAASFSLLLISAVALPVTVQFPTNVSPWGTRIFHDNLQMAPTNCTREMLIDT